MSYYDAYPYEVITCMSPKMGGDDPVPLYGVRNVETGIIEAYISTLPKAKFYAAQYQYDLAHPLKVITEEMITGAVGDMSGLGSRLLPKKSGKAN